MSTTVLEHTVCIVGGGLSGLITGKALKEHGIDSFVILEGKSQTGGVWQTAYRNVRLQHHINDFRKGLDGIPEDAPAFASKSDVLAAVEHMTTSLKDHIRYNEKVVEAVYDEDGRTWTVTTEAGTVVKAPWLTVANGCLGNCVTDGFSHLLAGYKGKVLHSEKYVDGSELFGKRVLVVGFGSSGVEIATDLARNARELTLLARTDTPWIFPRHGLFGRPMRLSANGNVYRPTWLRNILYKAFFRIRFGDLRKLSLKPVGEPLGGRVIVSDELYTYVAHKLVKVVTSEIDAVTEDGQGIVLKNGDEIKADCIILATGYSRPSEQSVPFLAKQLNENPPIEGLDTLYKATWCPEIPNAAFMGYFFGFVAVPSVVSLQAQALVRQIKGEAKLPSNEEMHRWMDRTKRARGSTQKFTDNHAFAELQREAHGNNKAAAIVRGAGAVALAAGLVVKALPRLLHSHP